MDFLSEEDRKNLVIEYKHMHDDNWQRGQGVWLVNSILVTGSLLVAFQSNTEWKFLGYMMALALVMAASTIQITTGKVTSITYERMKEIRTRLGMTETTEMYESKLKGKWWFVIRRNTAYVLFLFLGIIYLSLLLKSLSLV